MAPIKPLLFRIRRGYLALGVDPAHQWGRSPFRRDHVGDTLGDDTYYILSVIGFFWYVVCDGPEMLHVLTSHLSLFQRGNPIGPGLVKSLLHVLSYVKRSFFRDSIFSAGYTGWPNPLKRLRIRCQSLYSRPSAAIYASRAHVTNKDSNGGRGSEGGSLEKIWAQGECLDN